jgi:hypothetical protein
MVPSERCLVDFGQSKSATLVGVLDVREVIVEVVESGVSAGGLVLSHRIEMEDVQTRIAWRRSFYQIPNSSSAGVNGPSDSLCQLSTGVERKA